MRCSFTSMSTADCTNCSMLMHQIFLHTTHKLDSRKFHHLIVITRLCLWLRPTLTTSLLCAVQLLTSIHKQTRCFLITAKFNLLILTNPRKTCRLRCYKQKNMIVSLHTTLATIVIGNTSSPAIKFIHQHKTA